MFSGRKCTADLKIKLILEKKNVKKALLLLYNFKINAMKNIYDKNQKSSDINN